MRKIQIVITWFMISLVWFLGALAHTWSALPWLLFFLWLVLPVAHPCDYNSYRAWLADWRNWVKKSYL